MDDDDTDCCSSLSVSSSLSAAPCSSCSIS